MTVELTLPWPPSVNHLWKVGRGRVYLTQCGHSFRSVVFSIVRAHLGRSKGFGSTRVRMTVEAFPPDNRRRDLDNVQKALLDALAHAGLYSDDCQIDDLRIVRREKVRDGLVRVTVTDELEVAA